MAYKLSDNTWDLKELEAINRVIKSDMFTMGKEVEEYEHQFSEKVGTTHAVMSNSGSSANLLAIAALVYSGKLSQGDEVIVPAVSWSTTYFPLCQYNLKLKFIDIDKDTLNIDVTQIEEAISEKTKAIFAVNLLGNPNDYEKIMKICKNRNLILIEDNCEALGGQYADKKLGTFGLLGTYSTFYSHHISTIEGGITVTDDDELYHYLLSIRSHGWTRHLPENSELYIKRDDVFYESFNFIVPGYNLRPLEIEGAIGIEQLKKLDGIIQNRINNASYFIERIKEVENMRAQKELGKSSWFGFAMVLEGENSGRRNETVKMLQQNSIEVRPIVAGNFTRNRAIKFMNYSIHGELKNADDIHENGFFVGNHSKDNRENIDFLIDVLKKVNR
ncbi:aminotransferase class V-fold PLP-dependent enzyme [Acetobacterium fimetarium]|uniref:Aminotransferase class V-fold PLP-dependent enzyme n=1 Tax=Acetobacterium fimetarium TaxID=52691 RepID=A0ABR6WYT9_9FIRM|nr:aminotransferase class V-fold PLP-dependent enzyme [Acetobacterium fimetarium]